MKEDFHVDLSGCFFQKGDTGIACVGAITKNHIGCLIKSNAKDKIRKNLFIGKKEGEEYAKLYAICIFYLIKDFIKDIKTLIVCNDENFDYVKLYLQELVTTCPFEIINITEFKKKLGRNVKSLADNKSKAYRKRGDKPNRAKQGQPLNLVKLDYTTIETIWNQLK